MADRNYDDAVDTSILSGAEQLALFCTDIGPSSVQGYFAQSPSSSRFAGNSLPSLCAEEVHDERSHSGKIGSSSHVCPSDVPLRVHATIFRRSASEFG